MPLLLIHDSFVGMRIAGYNIIYAQIADHQTRAIKASQSI